MIDRKYCRTCQDTKPLDAFGLDRRSADGFRARCKACRNRDERERHATNPQAHRDAVKRSRAKYDRLHQNRLSRRTT